MPRRAPRTDANQAEVVKALRAAGIAVRVLAGVGDGFPDLIAALRGVNVLLELKPGDKPPSARRLTKDQIEFIATWPGVVYVVLTGEEAVRVVVEAARPRE